MAGQASKMVLFWIHPAIECSPLWYIYNIIIQCRSLKCPSNVVMIGELFKHQILSLCALNPPIWPSAVFYTIIRVDHVAISPSNLVSGIVSNHPMFLPFRHIQTFSTRTVCLKPSADVTSSNLGCPRLLDSKLGDQIITQLEHLGSDTESCCGYGSSMAHGV